MPSLRSKTPLLASLKLALKFQPNLISLAIEQVVDFARSSLGCGNLFFYFVMYVFGFYSESLCSFRLIDCSNLPQDDEKTKQNKTTTKTRNKFGLWRGGIFRY